MSTIAAYTVGVGVVLLVIGVLWQVFSPRVQAEGESSNQWLIDLLMKFWKILFDPNSPPPMRMASGGIVLILVGILIEIVTRVAA